jgi:hypothetical protein
MEDPGPTGLIPIMRNDVNIIRPKGHANFIGRWQLHIWTE